MAAKREIRKVTSIGRDPGSARRAIVDEFGELTFEEILKILRF